MFLIMKPNAVTLYLHTLNKREMALLEKDVIVKKSKLMELEKDYLQKNLFLKEPELLSTKDVSKPGRK